MHTENFIEIDKRRYELQAAKNSENRDFRCINCNKCKDFCISLHFFLSMTVTCYHINRFR